jgi:hypothetical protein
LGSAFKCVTQFRGEIDRTLNLGNIEEHTNTYYVDICHVCM